MNEHELENEAAKTGAALGCGCFIVLYYIFIATLIGMCIFLGYLIAGEILN
jgi:hypothetical protein